MRTVVDRKLPVVGKHPLFERVRDSPFVGQWSVELWEGGNVLAYVFGFSASESAGNASRIAAALRQPAPEPAAGGEDESLIKGMANICRCTQPHPEPCIWMRVSDTIDRLKAELAEARQERDELIRDWNREFGPTTERNEG